MISIRCLYIRYSARFLYHHDHDVIMGHRLGRFRPEALHFQKGFGLHRHHWQTSNFIMLLCMGHPSLHPTVSWTPKPPPRRAWKPLEDFWLSGWRWSRKASHDFSTLHCKTIHLRTCCLLCPPPEPLKVPMRKFSDVTLRKINLPFSLQRPEFVSPNEWDRLTMPATSFRSLRGKF